ncbi:MULTISPECIES: signal peptide peptidase SppA [Aerococcus]|uniref:signal peptide peptidase SppA n=1 Tax=Aerococcus TaxID=1375 RepID=UPI0018A73E06|nr:MULTISPECIES: signal peptide peptidase SppA [Aerococcus]MCY3035945.1 signal peptide peptidase SppA [Aerococcus sp. Group 2]MCY3039041.1 signal peptide peptidase SppA [Aerococcus sp. Group 2]MCY3040614.1 signal peptide peptidase SppA [Aerococcus sp. Group 2]MCY3042608.1 signal peptide peptidase SppA [Aerococcus sp. Group 2]MDK6520057.1 signal peptide peptidase SppA [Aerococcus urinae]
MNKKSWIVVIVAALILFFGVQSAAVREKEADLDDAISNKFFASDKTIEEGDSNSQVAVLQVNGTIADTGDQNSLFSANQSYDHQGTLSAIKKIKEDNKVKALLLEVDSPGGAVYESVELYRALKDLKESRQIPIYVSMKSMAASGGYMISMAADKIFADTETTTGSIGVILSTFNISKLLEEHGIKPEVFKSGDHKDLLSMYRDPSDEDREIINNILKESYDRFVKIVAEGRGMNEDEVRKLADGRIYSGQQALDKHLIDAIGYRQDALAALKADHDLEGSRVYLVSTDEDQQQFSSLIRRFSQAIPLSKLWKADTPANEIEAVKELTDQAPRPYYLYGGE